MFNCFVVVDRCLTSFIGIDWLSELHCVLVPSSKLVVRNDCSGDSSKTNYLTKDRGLLMSCSSLPILDYDIGSKLGGRHGSSYELVLVGLYKS